MDLFLYQFIFLSFFQIEKLTTMYTLEYKKVADIDELLFLEHNVTILAPVTNAHKVDL